MSYNPVTDTPFDAAIPADTLLVSNIPAELRAIRARVNEVAAGLYTSGAQIGVISIWHKDTPPTNFVECNGQSTAGLGTLSSIYGSNVPDYRGWFLRGWAHGVSNGSSEIEVSRVVGSQQAWMLGSHSHSGVPRRASIGLGGTTAAIFDVRTSASTDLTGGPDNRPANIAVMYIVRYQ